MNKLPFARFLTRVFLAFLSVLPVHSALPQFDDEACAKLRDFGKFYDNPEAKGLQSAKLFLSYQHQVGLIDGEEVFDYLTDPNDYDSDDDGLGDGLEIWMQTDPLSPDSPSRR